MHDEGTIDFVKMDGLVPVVVQDAATKEVLMVAYMNHEAWEKTIATGKMWYFSRKRRQLWMKGEQSGHVQYVKEIRLDCDNDCLLAQVDQVGGACDLGFRSCFEKRYVDGRFVSDATRTFDPSEAYQYSETLSVVIPSGSLLKQTLAALANAEFFTHGGSDGHIHAVLPMHGTGVHFSQANPRGIAQLVAEGRHDVGITGFDWVFETQRNVLLLADLGFNKNGRGTVPWALAVPSTLSVTGAADLSGMTVLTELAESTRHIVERHHVPVQVEYCREPPAAVTNQLVVELVESGETLRSRGFRPVCPILYTSVVIIVNRQSYSYSWKRRRIEELCGRLVEAAALLPVNQKPMYTEFRDGFAGVLPVRADEMR